MQMQKLTPELILTAYTRGLFPMADHANASDVYWYDPEFRGVLPIKYLHVPKRLCKTIQSKPYKILFNTAFSDVISGCAAPAAGRMETWINGAIRDVFESLHRAGYAHSIEAWQNGKLVGGLYGLAIGGVFFGESMFSRARDASKICLVHLVAHLDRQGYILFDTQFVNDHLKQFGVYELSRVEYQARLQQATGMPVQFVPSSGGISSDIGSVVSFESCSETVLSFMQSITQTS